MNNLLCTRLRLAALGACLIIFGACQKTGAPGAPATDAQPEQAAAKEGAEGVTLSADQVQKLGIETSPAKAASYAPEAEGYAVVMAHETLAQAVAELATAQAAQAAQARRVRGTHVDHEIIGQVTRAAETGHVIASGFGQGRLLVFAQV